MITTITPGHKYLLPHFENPNSGESIQFIEKNRQGDDLVTVNDGTTNEAVLEMLINRIRFLDAKCPCPENSLVIDFLTSALVLLDRRTTLRRNAGLEGKPQPLPADASHVAPNRVDVSHDQIAAAFTEWDRRFREDPDQFISEAKRLLTETPETYGEACAPYFIEILSNQR